MTLRIYLGFDWRRFRTRHFSPFSDILYWTTNGGNNQQHLTRSAEPQLHKDSLICWLENETTWFHCDTEAWLMWLTTDKQSFYWRGLTAWLMDSHDFSCWPAPASRMLTDHWLNNWDRLLDELCSCSSWRPGRGRRLSASHWLSAGVLSFVHWLKFESFNLQISLCNESKHCQTVQHDLTSWCIASLTPNSN